MGLKVGIGLGELKDICPSRPFDEHLDGPIRKLQQLERRADRADRVNVVGRRVILARILLGHEKDLLVVPHDLVQGTDGPIPAHEQGDDHVGKDHDVPKREDRIEDVFAQIVHSSYLPGIAGRWLYGSAKGDFEPFFGKYAPNEDGLGACLDVGLPIRVDIERLGPAFDHFPIDHNFLNAI